MSQLARGVRAALRNHQSMFLIEKRASSTYHGGLPNYWLKKSNPWKVKVVSPSSYLNPNGITNPRPLFSHSSSMPYATSTGKDDEVKNAQLDSDGLLNNLFEGGIALSAIMTVWDWFRPVREWFRRLRKNSFEDGSTRSYAMVHKQTLAYGLLLDLTKCNGFDELIARLDHMFRFNGELMSPSNRWWLVAFTDTEGYYTVIEGGHLDWEDFCNRDRRIYIHTRDEVEMLKRMNPGIFRSRR